MRPHPRVRTSASPLMLLNLLERADAALPWGATCSAGELSMMRFGDWPSSSAPRTRCPTRTPAPWGAGPALTGS
jgi:hypothetical protein